MNSSSKKKNDLDKMIPLFLEKLSQNMQNVDFKITLNKPSVNVNTNSNAGLNKIDQNEINNNIKESNISNQKQKEAISTKYNISNISINKNVGNVTNNFNVIDEIIDEDVFSRNSKIVSNSDLELVILKSYNDENNKMKSKQKISEKYEKFEKKQNSLTNQLKLNQNIKSQSNILQNTSKIKTYIKENKQKILTENNQLTINTIDTVQKPLNEIHSTRNSDKPNRLSPDTAKKYDQIKSEREFVSKGKK